MSGEYHPRHFSDFPGNPVQSDTTIPGSKSLMKNRTIKAVCAAAAFSGLAVAPLATAVAEEVRVPVMSQAERGAQENLPRTGMSQSSVRNGWGNPIRTSGPVGNPPISQWHYADFVVYFEADRVIHAVLKPSR
jgi:hypothetical protein